MPKGNPDPVAQTNPDKYVMHQIHAENRQCHICKLSMKKIDESTTQEVYECPRCGPTTRIVIDKILNTKFQNPILKETFDPIRLKNNLIFSSSEKIPLYYNDMEKRILLSNDENIKKNSRTNEYLIFSRFEKIAANQGAIKTYKHFLMSGASFAKEISKETGISLASAYRAIETLGDMDLIRPLKVLSLRKASGPAPTLYGLHDTTEDEEIKAGNRYLKTKRKTYRQVQEIVQLSLKEAVNQEIQFQKICFIAKKHNNKNFHFLDIAEQAALEISEMDYKVWR